MPLLVNQTTGQVYAENVRLADSWWERLAGFIPRATLSPDDGLWFTDCWAIHTLAMRARVDVIFLDESAHVLKILRNVEPNRPAILCRGARNVVELGAGALEGRDLLLGDRLELQ